MGSHSLNIVLLEPDVYSLKNCVEPDQMASDEAIWSGSAVFHAALEATVLIELLRLNWLENRSDCPTLNYSAG